MRSMVRFTVIVPLTVSMSDHFSPHISPMRSPGQTDVDAKVAESEVLFDEVEYLDFAKQR